jgi:hypothetical protein
METMMMRHLKGLLQTKQDGVCLYVATCHLLRFAPREWVRRCIKVFVNEYAFVKVTLPVYVVQYQEEHFMRSITEVRHGEDEVKEERWSKKMKHPPKMPL